ncbi:putative methyltransferase NSUN7 isoform X1 [Herpailurus yagouaroundi]|uniref:putative methyltransferase NSUN7 isoform X1 n=1 Tax=Herpailurus yagouaroundi TaxID=1608482 RepID=UPI001AD63711|nr:putative methyltransferase NSUN7 isoform X1 [Puma yagouaroundi]XP_040341005.1 putative methyltransferase NSUN7 isoform X1 [Puma yagouaroundi]XP_040341012.1 putative methyltransferase NSUN7 isoform X1 [Puma yagouaroundi]
MLRATSELEFSNEKNTEEISQLASLVLSGDTSTGEKNSTGLPEKTGYPDSVYIMAANIFQGIRFEKSPEKVLIKYGNEPLRSLPESEDESFRRSSYELAFSALKFQDILEAILIDSCIFPSTTIPDHLSSLIIVMLYDFQDRKFQARFLSDNEEPIAEVQEVENLLNSFKIKLAAALARCRIKHDALSIYHILPETVRNQELRASTLPLYAWINTCKISPEEVYYSLKKRGYNKVKSVLHIDDKVFAVDQHCYDVLIFPSHLKNNLLNIDLFKDYKLIFQDKSRSLAVHSVKALLNMDDDILMVNTGSWYTVAHMSILTNNTSKIFVCGVKSQAKDPDLKNLFTKMGCKNIEILHEAFLNIESKDHRLQKVKVILLLPHCSGLGVSNPVEFILNEHEDTGVLKDFSQGGTSEDKLHILVQQQYEQLTHAMKFTKAQAVVYCTCSVYPEENEGVVKKALEFQDHGIKVQPYRLSPPVLPLCSLKEIHLSTDKFFRMEPSEITNGCFLSVLTRERDPSEAVSVKDVLARAAAKGLLDGIELGKASKREKKKKKSKIPLSKAPTNDSDDIQMKIAEFLNRESNANANRSETLATKTSLPQKNTTTAGSSSHVRKPNKPTSNPSVPASMKNTAQPRPYERRTNFVRSRPEDRVMALKPVEIVLPPVMLPFSGSQGIKSQIPTQHFYYRWVGPNTVLPNCFPSPSTSRRGEKPRENLPSSLLRHPRPWL